jgi:uncharacterized protein (TIGR00255 family)
MIRSMTAFTRLDEQADWGSLSLELRSVNHRYLEVSLRLPEELRALDPKIRETVRRYLNRGKLDCSFRYQLPETSESQLEIDEELAKRLAALSREIDHFLFNPAQANSFDILRWPGVLKSGEPDWDKIRAEAISLLEKGLKDLVVAREREGDRLQQLIRQRLENIQGIVTEVRDHLPGILENYRQRLVDRLQEVKAQLDADRVEQEVVLLAQKMDVDEELDRLVAHVDEVTHVLEKDEPVGRRLDFLMQELNREANTLGSKSVSAETTRASVDLKVLIEQMREQVQNIE